MTQQSNNSQDTFFQNLQLGSFPVVKMSLINFIDFFFLKLNSYNLYRSEYRTSTAYLNSYNLYRSEYRTSTAYLNSYNLYRSEYRTSTAYHNPYKLYKSEYRTSTAYLNSYNLYRSEYRTSTASIGSIPEQMTPPQNTVLQKRKPKKKFSN